MFWKKPNNDRERIIIHLQKEIIKYTDAMAQCLVEREIESNKQYDPKNRCHTEKQFEARQKDKVKYAYDKYVEYFIYKNVLSKVVKDIEENKL